MAGVNRLVEALDITKDSALGMPVITSVGGCQLYIENFKSIVQYTQKELIILAKTGKLVVTGDELEIMYYDDDGIAVKGIISKIEF